MTDLISITVADGKYTIRQHAPGKWEALRHGEHWPAMASGPDNLHVALAYQIDKLRADLAKADRLLADPCVQKLEPEEPFFVLLGRDQDAMCALAELINRRFISEGRSDKVNAASATHKAFVEYRAKHERAKAADDLAGLDVNHARYGGQF